MAKNNPSPSLSPEGPIGSADRGEHISRRAYDLYLARGGEHGRDLDDWTQAERELDGGPDGGGDRNATEP
jgi:hypothetical protein